MNCKQIYRNVAFCPYKDDTAAAWELRDSLMTLRQYLDGQYRPYEFLDALRHLEYVCGQPVKRATTQFRRCLSWEDQSARVNRNKRYSGE